MTTMPSRGGPLAGVRVLEMTKVWAGPYAGKLLAFLGAEVIKIESRSNLDEMRAYGGVDIDHAPYFVSLNPEVLSVQVNTKSPEGLALFRDMVAKSDVVINNIRPGAMERSGLGYEELKKIKDDIIAVSIKMYGNDGPYGYQTGYAPCFAALSGMNYVVGYEDGPPLGINMRYGDSTVGTSAAFATVAALVHRARPGEGQFVDVSAVEQMSSMIGDLLFEHSLTGQVPQPEGNRHPDMAPHGNYPCRDGDWISIAVETDAEWQALCAALHLTELAEDPALATRAGRQAAVERIDAALAEATAPHDAGALAGRLRAVHVAGFKSETALDLIDDERLWAHEFFRMVSDWRDGSRPIVGPSWRMARHGIAVERGAPRLGEHNAYVYGEVLGLPPERIEALAKAGVID